VYGSQIEGRFLELLQKCLNSTERLTHLVQAMYEYAKLGSKAAKMQEVDLSALIEQVLEDLHFDDSLDIKVHLDDFPSVWGSEDLLRRVFVNLVNNAVKYNDKKQIEIRIGSAGRVDRVLASFCNIYVSDNGTGIPDDELEDIFAMFVRGTSADSHASGSGIGLAVVKRIIELHYGELKVTSTLGEGTRFSFTLPIERVAFLD